MTVGVPEISLDTWGLRYVKKKSPTQNVDTSTTETGRRGVGAHSNFESGKPSKNISATNRISDADVKTPDSPKGTHGTQGSDIDRQHHRDDPKITGTPTNRKVRDGKVIHEGESRGLTVSGLGETGKPRKLTSQGKPSDTKNIQNPDAVAAGREASHDSGHRSVEARSGKDRVGVDVDPEKKGKPTHSALPKAKAEMELAIIKCKLLKMNDISKKGEWDHLPHAQKEKEHDKEEDKVEKGTKDYGSDNTGRPSIGIADDPESTPDKQSVKDPPTSQSKDRADESVTSYGEGASGNQYGGKITHGEKGDPQLNVEGKMGKRVGREDIESRASTKSDEIVEKAIELINEAYDEMKSTDFRKLKPTYEGDTEQAKKGATIVSEHRTGRGKPFCANCGRDHAKEDEKAVAADKEDPTLMVSGTGGGNKPSCPSCGHRPNKKAEDTEDEAGIDLKQTIEDLKETKKDAPSTTSSEGSANFVYSDVKEAKKQKQ